MPARIRNYLTCNADFDLEGGWTDDIPDESKPPGKALAEFLRTALILETEQRSEMWNEEGYGWSFNCEQNRVTINVLVQFVDHWLVICEIVSLLPSFLRSDRYPKALLSVRDAIDRAARADTRFHNLHWFTANEYTVFETKRFEQHRT